MESAFIKFHGTLPKINPDFLRCIYIYLVRGPDVLAGVDVGEDGEFQVTIPRNVALAGGGQGLQAVVGPAGMGKHPDAASQSAAAPGQFKGRGESRRD